MTPSTLFLPRARYWVVFAVVLFGRALIAAPNNGDIDEYDVPNKGAIVTMFPHFFPEWTAPGHVGKVSIETQINGVRRSKQAVLSLIRTGGRREYYFPLGIGTLSPRYIEAIVSVDNGVMRERLRNVFYDPRHRTVALAATYEFLPKILPPGKGAVFFIFSPDRFRRVCQRANAYRR